MMRCISVKPSEQKLEIRRLIIEADYLLDYSSVLLY
jgi:hypothetical protein